jgi:hypothetical protein
MMTQCHASEWRMATAYIDILLLILREIEIEQLDGPQSAGA